MTIPTTGAATRPIYNDPGHVCPDTGRVCMTAADAYARDDMADRHFWRYSEQAADSNLDPWRKLEGIDASSTTAHDGKPTSYTLDYENGNTISNVGGDIPVYMQRTKAEREADAARPPEPKGMALGEHLTAAELSSWKWGGGVWREINDMGHGGAALVVWQMEDDVNTGERNLVCEQRARILAASRDMYALLRESLDMRDQAARIDWLKRTEALIERVEADE